MKLRLAADVEVDPIYLLMHEPNKYDRHPFDERVLADAINKHLDAHRGNTDLAFIEMQPPADTGLSRWKLVWQRYAGAIQEYVADRGVRTAREVRAGLPTVVVGVLRNLSTTTLTIG